MKNCILFLLFFLTIRNCFAQSEPVALSKKVLNETAFTNWADVSSPKLSGNGKIIAYSEGIQSKRILIIKAVNDSWKVEFPGGSMYDFIAFDEFLFKKGKDSLMTMDLKTRRMTFLENASNYILPKSKSAWIGIKKTHGGDTLMLLNCKTLKRLQFPNAKEFKFIGDKFAAVFQRNGIGSTCVQWVDLSNGVTKVIFEDNHCAIAQCSVDNSHERLAFLTEEDVSGSSLSKIWYYEEKLQKASCLVDGSKIATNDNLTIDPARLEFSDDGSRVFFYLQHHMKEVTHAVGDQTEIWRYTDYYPGDLERGMYNGERAAVFVSYNLKDDHLTEFKLTNENVIAKHKDWALTAQALDQVGEDCYWNPAAYFSYYLLSLSNGKRLTIASNFRRSENLNPIVLSPTGKWVIYLDKEKKQFYSYETNTGLVRPITEKCGTNWIDHTDEYPEPMRTEIGELQWGRDDNSFLISDGHDIWRIDPSNKLSPIMLTNHYGRDHHIKFGVFAQQNPKDEGSIFVTAVDKDNKDRGFFKINTNKADDPQKCVLGPYVFGDWAGHGEENRPPIKLNNKVWLVKRSSATEAPNFFLTTDFVKFTKLTDVQPQKDWNWLTTELVKWTTPDGKTSDGILYKPENFDPSKKYPIIFNYYESRSDELNLFIDPAPSIGNMNIPWFVSRGYLVYVPDIHYKIGDPGISAFVSVQSAAQLLAKRPYIDSTKMALQGHSFGGYETNFIITHSHLFTAACSACGLSDLTAMFGSGVRGDYPLYWAEQGQGRLGATPWGNPEAYIRNSPIFYVGQISTPLLIMANRNDNAVPFAQGRELFITMRRAQKPVWLLQYNDGDHLIDGKSAEDYNARMTQFFDHFLKNKPLPDWMSPVTN
ncbi:MAG: alpha/beta hydrolase family protein [Mucilaginibacter sp.]